MSLTSTGRKLLLDSTHYYNCPFDQSCCCSAQTEKNQTKNSNFQWWSYTTEGSPAYGNCFHTQIKLLNLEPSTHKIDEYAYLNANDSL